MTALMCAAKRGDKKIVNLLLSRLVDANKKDKVGRIALMYAVHARWPEAVKLLLSSRSIQVNFKNYKGNTALDIAQQELYPSITSLRATKEDTYSKKTRGKIIDMLKKAGAHSELTR
jgi:hypothetical protein